MAFGHWSKSFLLPVIVLAALSAQAFAVLPSAANAHENGSGVEGNGMSAGPGVSEDGRFVVFESRSSNLVPIDTNDVRDIFVHDTQVGTTTRVSIDSAGAQANGNSSNAAISEDGVMVAFDSFASNLVPGDTNGQMDAFLHNLHTGVTERVSVSSTGQQGEKQAAFTSISDDGRFVVFHSASRLVGNKTSDFSDLFVRDVTAGTTELVSTSSAGAQSNRSSSEYTAISRDGRYVAFASWATNLVAGDTNGVSDIFLRDRTAGTTELISVDSVGLQGNGESPGSAGWRDLSISDEGRYIAYRSYATNLVVGDTNGVPDIFLRDRFSASTSRVSVGSNGEQGNGDVASPSLSADGRRLTFTSYASNLVVADNNQTSDVFFRDLDTGTTTRISLSSSGAEGNARSSQSQLAPDGTWVAFASDASNLDIGDANATTDVFLRRLLTNSTTRESESSDVSAMSRASSEEGQNTANSIVTSGDGASRVYDTSACPEQWFDPSEAACFHVDDVALGATDSTEPISADYLTDLAGPCSGASNPDKHRVVYLFIKGEGSRFSSLKAGLRDSAKRIDFFVWASARETNGSRHIRFDCTDADAIKIDAMRLPPTAKNGYRATVRAMRAKPGYDSTKRYLVFADWSNAANPLPNGNFVCGEAPVSPDDQPGQSNANNNPNRVALTHLRPQNPCESTKTNTALHEFSHSLGAVLDGAPDESRGHTSNAFDVLQLLNATVVDACRDDKFKNRLDCQDDSYFNTTSNLPARGTWLADENESKTGKCDTIVDPDDPQGGRLKTGCHWNTAWSRWLVGGGVI